MIAARTAFGQGLQTLQRYYPLFLGVFTVGVFAWLLQAFGESCLAEWRSVLGIKNSVVRGIRLAILALPLLRSVVFAATVCVLAIVSIASFYKFLEYSRRSLGSEPLRMEALRKLGAGDKAGFVLVFRKYAAAEAGLSPDCELSPQRFAQAARSRAPRAIRERELELFVAASRDLSEAASYMHEAQRHWALPLHRGTCNAVIQAVVRNPADDETVGMAKKVGEYLESCVRMYMQAIIFLRDGDLSACKDELVSIQSVAPWFANVGQFRTELDRLARDPKLPKDPTAVRLHIVKNGFAGAQRGRYACLAHLIRGDRDSTWRAIDGSFTVSDYLNKLNWVDGRRHEIAEYRFRFR